MGEKLSSDFASRIFKGWRSPMKHLFVRHQTSVADPLRQERLRRALAIIMEHQEDDHGSCTVRPSLHPQSTTGRNDCQSGQIPPSIHSAAGLESVTDA